MNNQELAVILQAAFAADMNGRTGCRVLQRLKDENFAVFREIEEAQVSVIEHLLDKHRPEPPKTKVVQLTVDTDGYITALKDNGEIWSQGITKPWQRIEGPGESDEGVG